MSKVTAPLVSRLFYSTKEKIEQQKWKLTALLKYSTADSFTTLIAQYRISMDRCGVPLQETGAGQWATQPTRSGEHEPCLGEAPSPVPNPHIRSRFRNQLRVDPGVHQVRRPYLMDRSCEHSSYHKSECGRFEALIIWLFHAKICLKNRISRMETLLASKTTANNKMITSSRDLLLPQPVGGRNVCAVRSLSSDSRC